jgi:hypothetical protein
MTDCTDQFISLTKIAYKETLSPSDPEVETFLIKLFEIVRHRATQKTDILCKQMIAEAFENSEEGTV